MKVSSITCAAKERGKGVLFATAHLGNWELSAYAHALLTEPMNVVVRPLDNPPIDEMVERRRALSGNKLLSKRDFARSIFQALRERAGGHSGGSEFSGATAARLCRFLVCRPART